MSSTFVTTENDFTALLVAARGSPAQLGSVAALAEVVILLVAAAVLTPGGDSDESFGLPVLAVDWDVLLEHAASAGMSSEPRIVERLNRFAVAR